ncbi:MAG: DUF4270 domain-containing protein [Cytophagales bacterium]|nr:DUF4270 domain-containing protein [Cytophagales bacterium]
MRRNSLVLKLICIVSAFFVACEDPNEVGSSLQQNNINTNVIDTFSIESKVVYYPNDITTNQAIALLVGTHNDAEFGTTEAKSFFQILQITENVTLDASATCDSVSLELPYRTVGYSYNKGIGTRTYYHQQFVGDVSREQTIYVHQLEEDILEQDYTTKDELTYGSNPVGSITKSHQLYEGGASQDSTYYLTIPLEVSTGNEILSASNNVTNDVLVSNFKGFALVGDEDDNNSILAFEHITKVARLFVYYHTDEEDSLSLEYRINVNSKNFNQITADLSTSSVNTLTEEGNEISTNDLNNLGYIQAGTGIHTQISLPSLQKFVTENNTVAINKAELEVFVNESVADSAFENGPPFNIVLTDIEQEEIRNDESLYSSVPAFAFSYDAINKKYNVNITEFVQELVTKEDTLTELIIAPSLNATRTNYTTFYDGDAIHGEKAMKLKIYYSEVK